MTQLSLENPILSQAQLQRKDLHDLGHGSERLEAQLRILGCDFIAMAGCLLEMYVTFTNDGGPLDGRWW